MRLFTLHSRPGHELEAIPDGWNLLALLFLPLWVVWHRLWVTLVVIVLAPLAVGLISPLGALLAFYALAIIAALEGGAIRRAELRLHGWREVGCVLAATEEGAEELYLNGQIA